MLSNDYVQTNDEIEYLCVNKFRQHTQLNASREAVAAHVPFKT